jgi:predicted enzyme related to lactoylglutathione lyase
MDVTPILPVLNMATAAEFYEAAGFDVRVYEGGGYAFVNYNDESVFDLGLKESATGAGCYIIVPGVDDWHTRLSALGYSVTPVLNEPHGMREFTLTDPDGNRLRFGRGI